MSSESKLQYLSLFPVAIICTYVSISNHKLISDMTMELI